MVETIMSTTEQAIIRTLRDYPNITKSMLGTSVRRHREDFEECLERLVNNGTVTKDFIIRSNSRASVVYRLASDASPDTR